MVVATHQAAAALRVVVAGLTLFAAFLAIVLVSTMAVVATHQAAAALRVVVAGMPLFDAFLHVVVTDVDNGQVVVAAGCIGNGRTAIGRHANVGHVGDVSTVDHDRATRSVADADGAASIAAAVDVTDGDRAAVGGSVRDAAVAGARDAVSDCIPQGPGPPPASGAPQRRPRPATRVSPGAASRTLPMPW